MANKKNRANHETAELQGSQNSFRTLNRSKVRQNFPHEQTRFMPPINIPKSKSSGSLNQSFLRKQLALIEQRNQKPRSQKQQCQNLRYLNSIMLKDAKRECNRQENQFLCMRADIISKKFVKSLEKVRDFNQQGQCRQNKMALNSGNEVKQGVNYINRIVHRHKEEEQRYTKMMRGLKRKVDRKRIRFTEGNSNEVSALEFE